MAVRPLETSALSDDLMSRVYEVMTLCHAEVSAGASYRSLADAEAFLRHVPDVETRDYWIAESDGDCVGFAQLGVSEGSGRVEILVRPDARRRGHGTVLRDTVLDQAKLRGARRLVGRHATEAGSRFAAAAGAVDDHREVHSLLRLPLAPDLTIQPVDGYAVRSWLGAAPTPLLDSYVRARQAINDAPGFDESPDVWSAARVRDLEATLERRNRDMRVTVAVDDRNDVVAFTELRVSRTPGATAGIDDTAVVPAHRRRGLGRWVKLESLLRLQQDRPDVPLVTTANAEQNDAILALNRSLGFSPVAVYTNCALQLAG
jgi:mycothiol synthase